MWGAADRDIVHGVCTFDQRGDEPRNYDPRKEEVHASPEVALLVD